MTVAVSDNLDGFGLWERVTLEGDRAFLALFLGRVVDGAGRPTGEALVNVILPGRSGLHGTRRVTYGALRAALDD